MKNNMSAVKRFFWRSQKEFCLCQLVCSSLFASKNLQNNQVLFLMYKVNFFHV